MARKLPWLKGSQERSNALRAQDRPVKRQRIEEDLDLPDGESNQLPLAKNLRAGRTPSTSPPPEAPTEEYMRQGLLHDDKYIMVEDEFYATARTFTAHLHHAEYVRLRTLAKSANASAITNISRPVDSVTSMSDDLRRQKRIKANISKHTKAVERIGVTTASDLKDSRDGSESDLDMVTNEDLWVGTSLHGLMKTRANTMDLSLTGLHGVKSRTRAAAGYSKPAEKIERTRRYDIGPRQDSPMPTRLSALPLDENDEETASDSDDLDALVVRSTRTGSATPATAAKRRTNAEREREDKSLVGNRTTVLAQSLPKAHVPFDLGETFPKATPLQRKAVRWNDMTLKQDSKETSKSINEIPMFLV